MLAPDECDVGFVLNWPLVNVNWPVPTIYFTISPSKRANPLSVVIPEYFVKDVVSETETVVPSAVISDVVAINSVSGSTSSIFTWLVAPWWAWLYCTTSNTFPVWRSPFTVESPFTLTLATTVLLLLLLPYSIKSASLTNFSPFTSVRYRVSNWELI